MIILVEVQERSTYRLEMRYDDNAYTQEEALREASREVNANLAHIREENEFCWGHSVNVISRVKFGRG